MPKLMRLQLPEATIASDRGLIIRQPKASTFWDTKLGLINGDKTQHFQKPASYGRQKKQLMRVVCYGPSNLLATKLAVIHIQTVTWMP